MKKLPVDEIQVVPINAEKTIIPLVEQLNGLIDRYKAIFEISRKLLCVAESPTLERVQRVLDNIEKAIDALCLQLCEPQFILKN